MSQKSLQTSESYDEMYSSGGYKGVYRLPYRKSPYYPLFRAILRQVRKSGTQSILEVGSGNGALAQMILTETQLAYCGFDFSATAVAMAQQQTGRSDLFCVGDARDPASYTSRHDCIICSEVLEHIHDDLDVMANWRPGVFCVCSVPNYDSAYHVRHFRTEEEVRSRYGSCIKIDYMGRVVLPDSHNLNWATRAKAVLAGVCHPHRLRRAIGLKRFSEGGWFVFSGRRVQL